MDLTIADALTILGLSMPVTVAAIKMLPWNGSRKNGGVNEKMCDDRHKGIDERLTRMEGKIDHLLSQKWTSYAGEK